MRTLIAIVMVLMAFVPVALAQNGEQTEKKEVKKYYLYEWTDSKGGVHITDNLGEVPVRYRLKARKIEIPKGQEVGPEQQVQGEAGSSPGVAAEAQEAASKAAWQQRVRDWKARLADAQERYRVLDQKHLEALGKWGGVASGRLEGRIEADSIQKEMEGVQQDINEAKDMIETVIPEEARRAGIPPGWLRE
jgi:Domain of unknown function (DUF4124)